MVSVILLERNAPCRVFTQAINGRVTFNEKMYQAARNRNSIGLAPTGQGPQDLVWAELKAADASNHVMAARTGKDCFHYVVSDLSYCFCFACCSCVLQDAAASAGRGASGEGIAADAIVKCHAYSLITADGRVWR